MAAEFIRFTTALVLGAASWAALPAQAQTGAVPQARDMIDALSPSRQRNLQVRQTPEAPPQLPAATPATPPAVAPAPAPAATPAATPAKPPAPQAVAPVAPPALPAATPTPTPTPTPAAPAAAAAEPSLSLALSFDPNSARLRPESGAVLGNLVAAMMSAELKAHRFVIEGHTDASGNSTSNQRLSQARADEVRLYLVALGVHPSRLKAVGKGSSEPANPKEPLAAENRRVRVVTVE